MQIEYNGGGKTIREQISGLRQNLSDTRNVRKKILYEKSIRRPANVGQKS
jgi:hypothetical protein